MVLLSAFLLFFGGVTALDNGLALRPPMGWRSWNCFHGAVNDTAIKRIAEAMTAKRGGGESLLDLGFDSLGVDDGWQACGAGHKKSFHAADGTPVVNRSKFPDLKALVNYGHERGIFLL